MKNNSLRTFIVTDIDWDIDGEDIELPEEITIAIPEDEELEEDEIQEYLSDKVSDVTGFLHFGFTFKQI